MAFEAPRILKEPVFWKLSHLKKSRAPATGSSELEVSMGVRWIRGEMRVWASQIASHDGALYSVVSNEAAVLMSLTFQRSSCRMSCLT